MNLHSFSSTVGASLSETLGTAPGLLCFLLFASFLAFDSLISFSSACADFTCLGTCLWRAMRDTFGCCPYFSLSFSLLSRATLSLSLIMANFSLALAFHALKHISSDAEITYLLSRLHATAVSLCILFVW